MKNNVYLGFQDGYRDEKFKLQFEEVGPDITRYTFHVLFQYSQDFHKTMRDQSHREIARKTAKRYFWKEAYEPMCNELRELSCLAYQCEPHIGDKIQEKLESIFEFIDPERN